MRKTHSGACLTPKHIRSADSVCKSALSTDFKYKKKHAFKNQWLTFSLRCQQISCWCWRSLWSCISCWCACFASCRVTRALASSSSRSLSHCWVTTVSCVWVKRCESHKRSCSTWTMDSSRITHHIKHHCVYPTRLTATHALSSKSMVC